MTKEEYLARFKAEMLKYRETFYDGSSVAEYADEISPSYYEESDGYNTPEEDAQADMDEWEVAE